MLTNITGTVKPKLMMAGVTDECQFVLHPDIAGQPAVIGILGRIFNL